MTGLINYGLPTTNRVKEHMTGQVNQELILGGLTVRLQLQQCDVPSLMLSTGWCQEMNLVWNKQNCFHQIRRS